MKTSQIACRCNAPLDAATITKMSMFCHVGQEQVLAVHDVASVYHVPLLLQDQGIVRYLTKRLHLNDIKVDDERRLHGAGIATRWKELTIG